MEASLPAKQKGAAAIEFALVFILFFAVFYGVISYSLPLLMLQSFQQASAEAVRRCVALDPASATYDADVKALARQVVTQQTAWMPAALNFKQADDAKVTLANRLLTVEIRYSRAKLEQVIPFLVLPGIGTVPNLPATLVAQSSLQL
ncbi:TadE/TadG family type IV pilus assembly protein [Pseudomonas sp. R5(2019)]|uniref:TadE/TadG family type IV pilus assembly protein n=1 Tax=Pseudomonas sp. R5(2019) TaxID=2697566 RepID=UPI0014128A7A|nr:TadE/TadG family type IV pilus assembly protein [Pseudomonas sp. R5(2019)]NBA95069.1 pilus assembly protein [Pseudomonas sp. R5(2019)]